MNLNEILHSAQGGQAVSNLARLHGLTAGQAEAATTAMLPAFSLALERLKSHPDALGALVTALAGGGHEASYAEPPAGGAAGADAAAVVFGAPEAVHKAVESVSQASGVAPATVAAMLPEVASILLGGLAQAMAKQGLLGDLAAAASSPGGLGGALGHGDSGGLMGLLGSIFGGSQAPVPPETVALAGGVAALAAMFAVSVQASQAQQASLAAIAQSMSQPPTSI